MTSDRKTNDEGGAKDAPSSLEGAEDTPALVKENRQAVKNQGKAMPEDYPDRDVGSVV